MAARRSKGSVEAVNGLVLLDKPAGITSNGALQRVKRAFGVRKAGHTGSLDPAATGMLPICLGEATKVCAFLLESDKCYRVTARLGEATDTGDADGAVTATADVPLLAPGEWSALMSEFVGESEQVPPMYSALKKDGRRLYELARQGETVERAPRPVRIDAIALAESAGRRLVFRVRCSKGTYVRTLVEDIARAAGTVAHTQHLHRESVDPFVAADMHDMGEIERRAGLGQDALLSVLLPVDRALFDLDAECLEDDEAGRFLEGQRLRRAPAAAGLVRVYGPGERFLGVAERDGSGRLAPRRVFRLPSVP